MKNKIYIAAFISSLFSPVYASSGFETYGDIGQFAIPAIAAGISWYKDDYDGLKDFGYSFVSTTATVEILKKHRRCNTAKWWFEKLPIWTHGMGL